MNNTYIRKSDVLRGTKKNGDPHGQPLSIDR